MYRRFGALALLCAISTSTAAYADPSTAKTTAVVKMGTKSPSILPSSGGVFIKNFSTIFAQVSLADNGSSLTINGHGYGFNPTLAYTSFFYGIGSVPIGSLACLPPTPNNLTVTQMITAYWLPIGSPHRTLHLVNSGASYTPLATIGTMSVRYDSTPNLPLNVNLNPGRFWLNSCGLVISHPL